MNNLGNQINASIDERYAELVEVCKDIVEGHEPGSIDLASIHSASHMITDIEQLLTISYDLNQAVELEDMESDEKEDYFTEEIGNYYSKAIDGYEKFLKERTFE